MSSTLSPGSAADEVIDIFVSYARSDDEPPTGTTDGWVTTLRNELQKVLRRKLGGRGARVWMDHELTANQPITHELRRRLQATRVLVLVLSPGYQQSRWCQMELGNFVAQAQAAGQAQNIFPIEIDEFEEDARNQWHPALQSLIPLRFWEKGPNDVAPRLAGYPFPKLDEDSFYWRNVNELAHLVAKRLKQDPQPDTGAAPKAKVVLAEVTDDLDDQRQLMAAALNQRRDVVLLPATDYLRGNEADFCASVRADLQGAALFVQLLGAFAGKRAPGSALSYVALQSREAQAALQRDPTLQLLQWCSPEVDPALIADPLYRELLAAPQVQRQGFEEFRAAVLRRLDERARPALPRPVALLKPLPMAMPAPLLNTDEPAASGLSLYLQAAPEDRDMAEEITEHLFNVGATVLASPDPEPGQTFLQSLQAQEEALRMCDGVVLLYGRSPVTAVTTAFQYALRVFGLRRRHVWSAVLDLPPAEKPRVPLRSPNLVTLECRQGFTAEQLGGFFAGLRQVAATGAPHA